MTPWREPLKRKKVVPRGVEAVFRGHRSLEAALFHALLCLTAEVRNSSKRIGKVPDLGLELLLDRLLGGADFLPKLPARNPRQHGMAHSMGAKLDVVGLHL